VLALSSPSAALGWSYPWEVAVAAGKSVVQVGQENLTRSAPRRRCDAQIAEQDNCCTTWRGPVDSMQNPRKRSACIGRNSVTVLRRRSGPSIAPAHEPLCNGSLV
jgi:hypothetical protein